MNREVLAFEVARNQIVLDYPLQLLMEVDLLLRPPPPKNLDLNTKKPASAQTLTAYRVINPNLQFE